MLAGRMKALSLIWREGMGAPCAASWAMNIGPRPALGSGGQADSDFPTVSAAGRGIDLPATQSWTLRRGTRHAPLDVRPRCCWRSGPRPPRTIRPSRSPSWCRPRPAGRPTPSRASPRRRCRSCSARAHHRERRRRRRHHRHHPRRARRAGWLHAADLPCRACDRGDALPQSALRHADGVHLDRADHRCADDDHRAQQLRAEYAAGAGRASEEARRQSQHGQRRRRLRVASLRHAVHVGDQGADHHRAVSRHRAR